jgi:hypothetical protein
VAVSCPANGYCTVASARHVVNEVHGAWGKPQGVPTGYQVDSLSCTEIGYCSAAADYSASSATSSVAAVGVSDESAGGWGPWNTLPGTVIVNDPNTSDTVAPVSCGTPGNCALYGAQSNRSRPIGQWAAGKSSVPVTATTLTLATPKLTYGQERAEHLSVTEQAAAGTPTGTVTVTAGAATLCVIKLSGDKGGCTLTQRALPVGTAKLAAYYGINAGFAASHSGQVTLTVVK